MNLVVSSIPNSLPENDTVPSVVIRTSKGWTYS